MLGTMGPEGSAEARVATAQARLRVGDLHGAFTELKACLKAYPEEGTATAAMGRFLAEHGDAGTAAALLSRAMRMGRTEAAPPLARLLAGLGPDAWDDRLDEDLRLCLGEATVEAQTLAHVAAQTLLLKQPEFDGTAETLETTGRDTLWLTFLTRCLNVSSIMEARLEAMRDALVRTRGDDGEGRRTLICALALNGFAAEYLADPPAGQGGEDEESLLLTALYRRLTGNEARVLGTEPPVADLLHRTVEEPARERVLADALDRFTPEASDDVSAAVREQYERNPYPRWSAPPSPEHQSLGTVVAALQRLDLAAFGGKAQSLLVAGCGTGFEPIDLARRDPSLRITAMDLSRTSLAYGARVAGELGLDGIRFVQGDILALDQVTDLFDVVISTGVIHHMDRPEAGLARLADVLRPGGVVRLSLYSERARAVVRLAHQLIQERGWRPLDEDIRAFRAHVLTLPETNPLAALRRSEDFYSLSGCRDLVFHVREHRYTPTQLGDLLASAELKLIGFEAPPEALTRFREVFGDGGDTLDLTLWDRLERDHPEMFAGMYQFWAQKPGQA
jgi:SAM-dependent methyltransferase